MVGCSTPFKKFGPNAPSIPTVAAVAATASQINKDHTDGVTPAQYVMAGYFDTYGKCNAYFDALIQIQNQNNFAGDVVTAAGSTTSAMVALRKNASDAANSLARIAAGTTFITTVISSFDERALMTPYPSETKSLILSALQTFEAGAPPEKTTTWPKAVLLVQRHAELCTYSGITRFAKQALSQATVEDEKSVPSILSPEDQVDADRIAIAFHLNSGSLSERELALLHHYINVKAAPYADDPGKALLKQLPSGVRAVLSAADGTPKDPSTVAEAQASAKTLKAIIDRNEEMKALAAKVANEFAATPPKPGPGSVPAPANPPEAAPTAPAQAEPPAPFIKVRPSR